MSCEHIPYRQRPLPRGRAEAFTLVEMLTVMAVVGILLAIGLPGWMGLNSTGTRRAAVSKMMGIFDQARGMAITDSRNTYVVFAAPVGQMTDQSKWGRACAIYEDDDTFSPTQRSGWSYLPTGVAFKVDPGSDPAPTTSIMNRPPPGDGTAALAFPVSAAATGTGAAASIQLPYLKFDSTGSVDLQEPKYLRVLIFQGSVTGPGTERATKRVASTAAPTDAQKILLDEVRINPATGRAKYIVSVADNLATPTPAATPSPTP